MANAIVNTRNFRANLRRDENGKVDMKNGQSFIELINSIRTEVEAYMELGELQMAENQCRGLIKLEKRLGYLTGEKLMVEIKELKAEAIIARREQIKRETKERHDQKRRIAYMVSLMERIAQNVQSKKRIEMARMEREKELAELAAKRELRMRAKEDRSVWLAHHEELDNTLTHNPFAALAGYVPVKKEEPTEVPLEETTTEEKVEVQVDVALALYTQAIEACQEIGQWEEVQSILGDEFFMRNITEELVEELHEAMELVADNQ